MARKKQIHVDAQFGLSEAEMDGDPKRLQQVFSNLFSNAIKFTPSGGNVRVTLESSGDDHAITVSDTGEGISAEFLPFVFDRYRQADRTASRRGGLGLGLTIARHIVELHGGTIKAESAGKGKDRYSSFNFRAGPANRGGVLNGVGCGPPLSTN